MATMPQMFAVTPMAVTFAPLEIAVVKGEKPVVPVSRLFWMMALRISLPCLKWLIVYFKPSFFQ